MNEIIQQFNLFMLEQDFRNNTTKTLIWYETNISRFIEWLSCDTLDSLTLENFKRYVSYLNHFIQSNGNPLSSASINSYVRAVKAFYNWLIEEDKIPDFSRKLRVNRVFTDEITILSDDEIQILFSSFDENNVLELRNKCWCSLMVDSGLRRGEVLKLKICDVDFKHNSILVNGKGRKQRFVPLGSSSVRLLKIYKNHYRELATKNDSFFVNRFGSSCSENTIKQVFQDLKKTSGIERIHPHLLRHTFATNYLLDGGDLETLRIILGHSDIQITQVYLHLASNKKLINSKHLSHIDKLSEG